LAVFFTLTVAASRNRNADDDSNGDGYWLVKQNKVKLTIKSTNVLHGDLAVTPDSADNWVQLTTFESSERNAEVASISHEA